jgi:hypothetical protein
MEQVRERVKTRLGQIDAMEIQLRWAQHHGHDATVTDLDAQIDELHASNEADLQILSDGDSPKGYGHGV